MPVAEEIAAFREALVATTVALNMDPATLWASEDAAGASVSAQVLPERLISLDQPQLSAWLNTLHGAFEVRIRLPGEEDGAKEDEWPKAVGSYDFKSLTTLLGEARRFKSPVKVEGNLVKRPLERRVASVVKEEGGSWSADLRVAIFFSGDRLKGLLSGADYRYFENSFLGAPDASDKRLLMLVADTPGRLVGDFLAVLGKDQLNEAGAFAASPVVFDRLQAARELMSHRSQWAGPPSLLTPDFFTLDEASTGLESFKEDLVRIRNQLSVSYLANRTEPGAGEPVSTFEGTRSVQIPVLAERQAQGPYELFRWTYGDAETARTKLEIVRRVVASRLPDGKRGFEVLCREGRDLISEAEIQLRILIDENIVKNFERWQKVEELARDYSDKGADRIRGLTREAADHVYKTVGLLLGVALAYLLKPDQGPLILLASVAFYALYIIVVVVRIYLPSLREEHDGKRRAFLWSAWELRKLRILSAKTRGRLRWVLSENRRFNKTFRKIRRFYIWLALVPLLAAALWLVVKGWPEAPEQERALAVQVRRFEMLGYEDVRTRASGTSLPVALQDAKGMTLFPDLSAISKAGRLVVLSYVPCSGIGKEEEFQKLRRLHEAAERQRAELQLLTQVVCGEENGPRRLGAWLRVELPDLVVWTP